MIVFYAKNVPIPHSLSESECLLHSNNVSGFPPIHPLSIVLGNLSYVDQFSSFIVIDHLLFLYNISLYSSEYFYCNILL